MTLQFAPIGAKFLDLDTDEFGTIPESLERVMSPWSDTDPTATDTNMPRVIYTIPNGVNPTGACLTEERKRKIYQVWVHRCMMGLLRGRGRERNDNGIVWLIPFPLQYLLLVLYNAQV